MGRWRVSGYWVCEDDVGGCGMGYKWYVCRVSVSVNGKYIDAYGGVGVGGKYVGEHGEWVWVVSIWCGGVGLGGTNTWV